MGDSLNISFQKMVVVGGCWHPKDFLVTSWLNRQTKTPFWSSGMADVQLRLWYKHPIPHPQSMVGDETTSDHGIGVLNMNAGD